MATRLDEMRRQCQKFHKEHPEVWSLFVGFTFEKIRLGYDHYGVGAVMERVRWETSAGGSKPEFKFNNNFRAFYARRFARTFPEHKGFFRTRVQNSAKRKPKRTEPKPLTRAQMLKEFKPGLDALFKLPYRRDH